MPKKNTIDYKKRAAFIRQFETIHTHNRTNFTPQQKRHITRRWNDLKKYSGIDHYRIDRRTREYKEMTERGYKTTQKGVFLDGFRDTRGNKIKGNTVAVLKGGVIRSQLKGPKGGASRTDYIYNFSAAEKRQFLKDPEKFIKQLLNQNPTLAKHFDLKTLSTARSKQKLRFQIAGAYGTHSNLDLSVLEHYIKEWQEAANDPKKPRAASSFDNLTGIRLVEFKPVARKKAKKKRGKKK